MPWSVGGQLLERARVAGAVRPGLTSDDPPRTAIRSTTAGRCATLTGSGPGGWSGIQAGGAGLEVAAFREAEGGAGGETVGVGGGLAGAGAFEEVGADGVEAVGVGKPGSRAARAASPASGPSTIARATTRPSSAIGSGVGERATRTS